MFPRCIPRICPLAALFWLAGGCRQPAEPSSSKNNLSTQATVGNGEWTGEEPIQGTYAGPLTLALTINGNDDICEGTVTFDVDTEVQPPIVGIATCAFSGPFQAIGDIESDLEAGFGTQPGVVTGTARFSLGREPTTLSWTGTFDETSLESHLEDSMTVDRYEVVFSLDFEARPDADGA